METVTLSDKSFSKFIIYPTIQASIKKIADQINSDYKDKNPIFLAVLNGSFMFAADLLKEISISCEISFVKLASYHGMSSTGTVTELIGLTEKIENRNIIIVEDIVDTGKTIEKVCNLLVAKKVASVEVATLLLKPEVYKGKSKINYVCIEIPNEFIVGFGLDYNGLGRNLKDIYKVIS